LPRFEGRFVYSPSEDQLQRINEVRKSIPTKDDELLAFFKNNFDELLVLLDKIAQIHVRESLKDCKSIIKLFINKEEYSKKVIRLQNFMYSNSSDSIEEILRENQIIKEITEYLIDLYKKNTKEKNWDSYFLKELEEGRFSFDDYRTKWNKLLKLIQKSHPLYWKIMIWLRYTITAFKYEMYSESIVMILSFLQKRDPEGALLAAKNFLDLVIPVEDYSGFHRNYAHKVRLKAIRICSTFCNCKEELLELYYGSHTYRDGVLLPTINALTKCFGREIIPHLLNYKNGYVDIQLDHSKESAYFSDPVKEVKKKIGRLLRNYKFKETDYKLITKAIFYGFKYQTATDYAYTLWDNMRELVFNNREEIMKEMDKLEYIDQLDVYDKKNWLDLRENLISEETFENCYL